MRVWILNVKLIENVVILFLLFCCGSVLVLAVQEYPKVSVLKWMTAESQDWEYDNLTSDAISIKDGETETIYTVSQHLVALAVVCNASYPVLWVFNEYV